MARIILTREIAHASATDAGNRSMRKAGREKWDADDWNAMVAEFERLWPMERELDWIRRGRPRNERCIENAV